MVKGMYPVRAMRNALPAALKPLRKKGTPDSVSSCVQHRKGLGDDPSIDIFKHARGLTA
jgi:hypothetical protein